MPRFRPILFASTARIYRAQRCERNTGGDAALA